MYLVEVGEGVVALGDRDDLGDGAMSPSIE